MIQNFDTPISAISVKKLSNESDGSSQVVPWIKPGGQDKYGKEVITN